jgi:hypothetical protein
VTSPLVLGIICGIVFGLLAAASMLPMEFPDKRSALLGAFLNRAGIGFAIGAATGSPQLSALHLPGWSVGLAFGFVLSSADAVITKAYVPILTIGTVGGGVIGWLIGR